MTAKNKENVKPGMPGITVVYLIVAHGDPDHLARMIDALDNIRVRFFIHIDAKTDIRKFREILPGTGRIRFIKDRVKVYWGGYSQVEATLRLMEAAIREVPEFRYAVLLSGVHYPIKSNAYILDMLQNSDSEYLQFARTSEVGCEFKTNAFCLYDYKLFNPRSVYFNNSKLNRLTRMPGKLVYHIFRKLVPLLYKRKLPGDIAAYTGANWWALTRPCLQYILQYVKENRKYTQFFHLACQPDETFFHTIVCNSGFSLANSDTDLKTLTQGAMSGDYSRLRGLSLTFTKCSPGGIPKVLDESDFEDVRKELNYFG
ncbi:MAG TPA: hypothetical protein ENK49_06945, partial [Gammaproteobacteria bacterium]|nr:hypothetical protein [Gammaproteobacteria bacterium]